MSTPKFTPGPWRFECQHGDTRYIRSAGGDALLCDETYYPWCPNEDEDWNLIAAAPEMYEALEECEEYFDQRADADHNGERYVPDAAMRLLTTVRAALAKAEGRQP